MSEPGVLNVQGVAVDGRGNILVLYSLVRMSKREAMVHAAWLVALADENEEFAAILEAVRNT